MPESAVTVVIATYNRPDALVAAVNSVRYQTVSNWKLLVVGDGCDERTEEAMDRFDDERISYINLPARFGEQGGPNSVGMALADTPYIALLNHDDVFLPDHLEIGLGELGSSGGDIFIGCASSTWESVDDPEWGKKPVFRIVSSPGRKPRNAYDSHFQVMEPTSAWVFRKNLSSEVGPWRPATELYRAPLQEWLMRAWRQKARFVFGEKTTVLVLRTHYQNASIDGNYRFESLEHRYIDHLLRSGTGEDIRKQLARDLPPGGGTRKWGKMYKTRNRLAKLWYWPLVNPLSAWFYYTTGIDIFSRYLHRAGAQKNVLRRAIVARTGTTLPPMEDFENTLAGAIRHGRSVLAGGGLKAMKAELSDNSPSTRTGSGKGNRCLAWLEEQREAVRISTRRIPFANTRRWGLCKGSIRHESGGFFSVVGIRGTVSRSPSVGFEQPVIHQPEVGILGNLIRQDEKGTRILVQAKAEPGNVDKVQLSPTVQATVSNYTRVHGGLPTPFLEHFLVEGPWRIISDSRQSEQGTRFLGKYNRNVTVQIGDAPVEGSPGQWKWFRVPELLEALKEDYRVNTDMRSVLASCDWRSLNAGDEPFGGWLGLGGFGEALHGSFTSGNSEVPTGRVVELLEKIRRSVRLDLAVVPIHDLTGWNLDEEKLIDEQEDNFEVGFYRVEAPGREVTHWDQPLIQDLGQGQVVLVCQQRGGTLHFLFRGSVEVGFGEKVQFGPTVQRPPVKGESAGTDLHAPLLQELMDRPHVQHLSCMLSEEGGRFFRSVSNYRVIELDETATLAADDMSCWATLGQVHQLIRIPGVFTNEARSAIALLLPWLSGPESG